jgi:hypothetical protein
VNSTIYDEFLHSPEFQAVSRFCGERRAERSQVPLIRHIHEGRAIINALARRLPDGRLFGVYHAVHAYTLHPLFQNDADLMTVGLTYMREAEADNLSPANIMFAMEYRARANAWLSDKVYTANFNDGGPGIVQCRGGKPDAGPLPEVHAMLIADKVQNRKDFLAHHKGTHARSAELDLYFRVWLEHLGVSDSLYQTLSAAAEAV